MNHQDEGQLIIIENLDHIPHFDYRKHSAMVETFEKVADGKATKIIIPSELQNLAGTIAALTETIKK